MAKVGRPRLPTGPKPTDLLPTDKDAYMEFENDEILDPETLPVSTKEEISPVEKVEDSILLIPKPPSKDFQKSHAEEFYKYLATLEDKHWVQLIWYFYRTWPRIERPSEKYIDCGSYAFNEQWIIDNHGSGDYLIFLNQTGRKKDTGRICTAHIKVNVPDRPPKLVLSELDTGIKENKVYVDRLIAEGKLTQDGKLPMTQSQGIGTDAIVNLLGRMIDKMDRQQVSGYKDPKDAAITSAFEIISKGNETATKLMLDQMKEKDPQQLISLLTTLMTLMKPDAKTASNELDMMRMMMEITTKNNELLAKKEETNMNLMLKLMERASTPPPPPEDTFDKTLDRFSKIAEITGMGEGGGKKSTLETVMQYGAPVLGQILGVVQNVLAIRAQTPNTNQTQGGQANQANQTQANQPRIPLSISTAPMPEMQANQSNQQGETKPNGKMNVGDAMTQNQTQQQELIKEGLKQLGPQIIAALERGTHGDAFAEAIENFIGPVAYDQIASIGKPDILVILKGDEVLWAKLQSMENRLNMFIDEFIQYGEPELEAPETTESVNKGLVTK
jgi:small nuclear ribonucleoprotein (snRNP)-like protein